MKTKTVLVAYCYLFVFVFVFAFSFTMASKVQAELGCCIYEWCEFYDDVGVWGHFVVTEGCVFNGRDSCDVAYLCPEL